MSLGINNKITTNFSSRIDPEKKKQIQAILKANGLSASAFINACLHRLIQEKSVRFAFPEPEKTDS